MLYSGYVLPFMLYTYMLPCFTHAYVMILLCYAMGSNPNNVSVRAAPAVVGSVAVWRGSIIDSAIAGTVVDSVAAGSTATS
jgi:hypothetical protein